MNLSEDLLEYTIANNGFIDFCRFIGIMLSIVLASFCLVRFLQHERFYSAVGFGGLALLTGLQEAQAVGEPFVPWRLPLLVLSVLAGIKYMYFTLDQIKAGPTA